MQRLADHAVNLAGSLSLRVVYVDLDGTLLGPGGSLFAHPEGGVTREAAEAVAILAEAGVELVPVSGRSMDGTRDAARMVGSAAFIAEMGGLLVRREGGGEEVERAYPAMVGTPVERIHRAGVLGLLLERYEGRLEPHAPWAYRPRECTFLLRGQVEVTEVREALAATGHGWLDLLDNGRIGGSPERFPALAVEEVRAYHLVPAGVSKRSAIARDRDRRGIPRSTCVAVGDGPADVDTAPEVGAMFVVANGEGAGGAAPADNVYVTDRAYGLGFAEVVRALVGSAREPF